MTFQPTGISTGRVGHPEACNTLYETNNYSIVSKYSASKLNYFKDKFLEDFVETELKIKSWRRTPLVNRGYAARMMAVEWATERQMNKQCLIILGAGYDMLSLRHISRTNGHCIEFDLPEVMQTKYKYLVRKFEVSPEDILVRSENVVSFLKLKLHLVSCDIRNQLDFKRGLRHAFRNIPPDEQRRVAVLNEVCLCYIEPSEVEQIFSTLIRELNYHTVAQTLTYIGYEQVRSSETSPYAQVMNDHFASLGYPLKYFPTKAQLNELFKRHLNFQHLSIAPMYQVYHNALLPDRLSNSLSEPFDEFEEMDLYLSHYALVMGVNNLSVPIPGGELPDGLPEDNTDDLCSRLDLQLSLDQTQQRVICEPNFDVTRFGHASCALDLVTGCQSILISGGFGVGLNDGCSTASQHRRLADWLVVSRQPGGGWHTQALELVNFPEIDPPVPLIRMHGQVCYMGHNQVLISGGRDSPQPKCNKFGSYVVSLEGTSLRFMGFIAFEHARWRHRTISFFPYAVKTLMIGGLTASTDRPSGSSPTMLIESTDLQGLNRAVGLTFDANQLYQRHSFGADVQGNDTFLVFGGLRSIGITDHQVEFGQGAVLMDLREHELKPMALKYLAPFYDSQVHFINDYQFVNIGGVSTMTGEPNEYIELYDLRKSNLSEPIVRDALIPLVEDCGDPSKRLIQTKQTSVNFKSSNEIVTIGGGGNYFTFGTHFNRYHLIYNYSTLAQSTRRECQEEANKAMGKGR